MNTPLFPPLIPVPLTVASSEVVVSVNPYPRPRCRGCMADCPNYATCDGKLWRKDV